MKMPEILQPGKLKEINEYIYQKSGCFAFLLPDVQWSYSEPKGGKEAFEKWSIELYTIYHDYGCGYLKYILLDENIVELSLRRKLQKSKTHVDDVIKTFRNNFAHGIFDARLREEMKDVVSRYYIRGIHGVHWRDYFDAFSDDDWRSAAERLRENSDYLVGHLHDWADYMERRSKSFNPREGFGRSFRFRNSISKRVVYDSLDREFSRNSPSAVEILDKSVKKSDCKLEEWKDVIQKEFLDEKIKTSEDIILKLKELLYVVHNPMEESSVAIANRCGFSLDEF